MDDGPHLRHHCQQARLVKTVNIHPWLAKIWMDKTVGSSENYISWMQVWLYWLDLGSLSTGSRAGQYRTYTCKSNKMNPTVRILLGQGSSETDTKIAFQLGFVHVIICVLKHCQRKYWLNVQSGHHKQQLQEQRHLDLQRYAAVASGATGKRVMLKRHPHQETCRYWIRRDSSGTELVTKGERSETA